MIVFERYGHTFRIRDYDWKNIRKRFNPDNAKVTKGLYYIQVECSLCNKYKCGNICFIRCPFERLEGTSAGCTHFFHKMLGLKISFGVNVSEVCWYNDKEARKQLKVLNNFMDKIEKENQNDKKEKLTHNE